MRRTGARGKVEAGPAILRFAHRGVVSATSSSSPSARSSTLGERTGETINLAVPGHGGVEQIAQVDSVHLLGTGQLGRARRPFHTLRARQGPPRLRRGRASPGRLRRAAAATIIDRDVLERRARAGPRGRRTPSAIDELEPGLDAIAAPVHEPAGDVVAALAISGPTLRLPGERLAGAQSAY